MERKHVIDMELLIAPISSDSPTGINLRETSTDEYYLAKDHRNLARASERAALQSGETSSDDALKHWHALSDVCESILTKHSKDLEIACWYLEALVRIEGFQGLRDGMALIKELISEFWEGLYPEPDEDGIETKIAPLSGLNGESSEGTLLTPIRNLKITQYHEFTFWHIQQAQEISRVSDAAAKQSRLERLGFSLDDVDKDIADTSVQHFTEVLDCASSALNDFKAFHSDLYEHCSHDAPPSDKINTLLEEVVRSIKFIAGDKIAEPAVTEVGPDGSQDSTESVSDNKTSVPQNSNFSVSAESINNREAALHQLAVVARFFRETEPHSPMAGGIERIVRWGRMSLFELMQELVPDKTAQHTYAQLTGVTLEGASSESLQPTPQPVNPVKTNHNQQSPQPKHESSAGGW